MSLINSLRLRTKIFYQQNFWRPKIGIQTQSIWLGNPKAGFFICPELLPDKPIVYSFGVGEDISFDLEMIERFNAKITAFDPTPASIQFVEGLKISQASFKLYTFGLQVHDGELKFYYPTDPNFSGTIYKRWKHGDPGVEELKLPFKSFSTILNELKPERIDVLKMDIEGSEYDVIDDVVTSAIPITQILIEFHHRFPGRSLKDTESAIAKLKHKGYSLAAVSSKKEEFTFVRAGN